MVIRGNEQGIEIMATARSNRSRVAKAQASEVSLEALANATAQTQESVTPTMTVPSVAVMSDALTNVINKTVDMGKSDLALKEAVIAAGGDKADVQRAFYIGRFISVLDYTQEQAIVALNLTNNPKKENKPDTYRDAKQQAAYDAMRGMWSARLKTWGLRSDHANAGNKNNGKGDDATRNLMSTEKLKAPPKAKVETSVELAAYMLAEASRMYDFFLLNKEHSAVKAARGSRLMGLTADYLAAIKEEVEAINV